MNILFRGRFAAPSLLVLAFVLVTAEAQADPKADAIVQKALNQKSPQDQRGTSTMTITDRTGVAKVRKMRQVSKETPEGTKAFAEFLEPADVNGTKFLTVSKPGAETDQRIYLPALKKVRKISSSSKDSEFLGSDLTYFDMEKRSFDDGTYTLLAEGETLDLPAAAGKTLSKVQTVFTLSGAPYSKTVSWIDPATGVAYRTECYDKKDGAILKTITLDEVKEVQGYLVATKTTFANLKKGTNTVMTIGDLVVDSGVKDAEVSLKRLEQ
jgi:hypothetical protein